MNQMMNIQILPLSVALFMGTVCFIAAEDNDRFDQLKLEGARRSTLVDQSFKLEGDLVPKPQLDAFRDDILPVLNQHCVPCHGPDKSKGRFRIDTLDPNLLEGNDVDWWLDVQAALANGEMPPPEESELSGEDRGKVMEWFANEIRTASVVRRATGGHSSFRRMTRYEYNYALQDLLGLPWEFARDLPPEAHSEDGFQNSSDILHVSVVQLETYRRLAREALMRATVHGSQPSALYWGVSMKEASREKWEEQEAKLEKVRSDFKDNPEQLKQETEKLLNEFKRPHWGAYYKDLTTGRIAQHSWNYGGAKYAIKSSDTRADFPDSFEHVAILPPGVNRSQKLVVELGNLLPDEGMMRVRVRASRSPKDLRRDPSMQLEFGWQASNEGRALMKVSEEDILVTAPPESPQIYQWDIPLGDIYPRNSVRKTSPMGSMPSPSEHIRLVNSSVSEGEIQLDYVEVIAPVYDEWPPASHKRIFFDSPNREDEPVYAKEILTAFIPRAWRRPVSGDELDRKLRLFHSMRDTCETFEEAMVEVLATVLASPHFLYVAREEESGFADHSSGVQPLTDHELATRLSLFLWCSVPDERLLNLADRGVLHQPEMLTGEVQRMLKDPRSNRFAKHFVRQWLDMQLLDFVNPKNGMGDELKEAMHQEPILFFQEVLKGNESILQFIHADYTMVNERLAGHYGLAGVYGNHFRRVALEPAHRRGGLMTQAGLLAMNASGMDSNPLKRGIWMLESLLNDPPPPPPPAVPQIDLADPEIAKMTLKERIADHRNHPACMSCHSKIDPWGIAFENFDALGKWREEINGKPVDATSRLFNNERLDGMDGLKRFLLERRQDQFVLAVTHKMCVYALGRPLSFSDHSSVQEIASKVRRKGDGLATLVQQVVVSSLFLSK